MAWSVRVVGMGSGLAGRGSPCRIKIPDVKASENKMIWLIEEGLSGWGWGMLWESPREGPGWEGGGQGGETGWPVRKT